VLHFQELNDIYRPRFLAWLREHGVRETCPACNSPEYALSGYGLVRVLPHIPSDSLPFARICRQCGHVMLFQAGGDGLRSEPHERADSVDNLHRDR